MVSKRSEREAQGMAGQEKDGEKGFLMLFLVASLLGIIVMNSRRTGNFKSEFSTVVTASSPYVYYFPWSLRGVKHLDLQPVVSATNTASSTYYDASVPQSTEKNNKEPFECCCYIQQQKKEESNGGADTDDDGDSSELWLPLKKVFCLTSYPEPITYEYSVDLSRLQRLCTGPECRHRLYLTSNSSKNSAITVRLNSGSALGSSPREYTAFCLLLCVCLLLSFDYLKHAEALVLGITVSFSLLAAAGRFPDAKQVVGWINASTAFFVVTVVLFVGILRDVNFFSWLASRLVRFVSGDALKASIVLWCAACLFSALFPTVPLAVIMAEVTLEVCDILQLPPFYPVMGVVFMINIGGGIFKYGSFLTIALCNDFGISFGRYFTDITLCQFMSAIVVFFVLLIRFGPKIKDVPVKRITWSAEKPEKLSDDEYGSDSNGGDGSSGSDSSDASGSSDEEYEVGTLPDGTPIRRSASGRSAHTKSGRSRLHRKLYLANYKLQNPGLALLCAVMGGVFFVLFLLQGVTGIDNGVCALLGAALVLVLYSPLHKPEALKKLDTSILVLTILFLVFIGSLDELGLNNLTCNNNNNNKSSD